jgi:hypothetical protein
MSLIIQDRALIISSEGYPPHLEIIGFITSTAVVDSIYVLIIVSVSKDLLKA